ncbi:MAG: hypothetical protein CMC13_08420 [Flavobacteriaceae bacterium]|nr:hypothetical protein [Flavobacteriaceae bacterium]|tara:strand:+ start:1060 stop:1986 length:927 start_codon:yes stop_codon:yes gene_type:complete
MEIFPLISIIIPTFNRANVLGETLDSVVNQTYRNWECIVIDDGSTDNTQDLVFSYLKKESRFQYFKRPEYIPKGPSACRNFGYEQSNGEYIQWFDSDDLMHPKKIELKAATALKNQSQVIIDQHSEKGLQGDVVDFESECFTSKTFYVDYLLGKYPVITNDVMLKNTIIGSERFDVNLWKGEEFEFFSRIFKQKLRFCFMNTSLTHYRISEDSISLSPNQIHSLIYLSKKIQTAHSNHPLILARAEYQGRKSYKNLIKNKNTNLIIKHFTFFRKVHHKSVGIFVMYLLYNLLTGRGFDRIKPKREVLN